MKRQIGMIITALMMTAMLSTAVSAEFVYSKMIAEVMLVKDSDGNEYEVTHRIDRHNLDLVEYYENVPVQLINEVGVDIVGIYIASSEDEEWGDNWLEYIGEGAVIPNDDYVYLTMNYAKNNMVLDVKLDLADENSIVFKEVDLTSLTGATHFEMNFHYNEDTDDYGITTRI